MLFKLDSKADDRHQTVLLENK